MDQLQYSKSYNQLVGIARTYFEDRAHARIQSSGSGDNMRDTYDALTMGDRSLVQICIQACHEHHRKVIRFWKVWVGLLKMHSSSSLELIVFQAHNELECCMGVYVVIEDSPDLLSAT